MFPRTDYTDTYLIPEPEKIFTHKRTLEDELQGAQSRQSPLKLTPQFGRHKSQSAVSGSVVYKKTPGLFKMGKEREEKVR